MRIDTNRIILIDDTPETLALSEGTVASESVFLVSPINPDDPASLFIPVGAFDGEHAMADAELFVFYATGQHLFGGGAHPSFEIDTVSDWRGDFADGVDIGSILKGAFGGGATVERVDTGGVKGFGIVGAEGIPAGLAEVLFGKDKAAEMQAAQANFQAFMEANAALEAEGYSEIESLAIWDASKSYRAGEAVFYKGETFGAPAAMDAGIAPNPEANEPWVQVQMMAVCNDPTDHECKAGAMREKLEALAAEEAGINTPVAEPAAPDASLN